MFARIFATPSAMPSAGGVAPPMGPTNTGTPDEFLCPITGDIMTDPVNVCAQGHIFERAAIEHWSTTGQNNCPTCRTPLGSHRPERHLKAAIEAWKMTHQPAGSPLGTPAFVDGDVAISASTFVDAGRNFLHIQCSTDPSKGQQGSVYILGLDLSGSMGELTDPEAKEVFYTRWDLLCHTVNVTANMLSPKDSLSLVTFSTGAKIILEPTLMDDAGKTKVKAVLRGIQPEGSTNIDAALRAMMSIANRPEMAGRNIFASLLTDGEETIIPSPSGTLKAISRVPLNNPWNLSTFGFGYSLNSVLLTQLSEMGGGSFGFIPDCTMIGTVLINWVANALVTGTRNAVVQYTVNDGAPTTFSTGPIAMGQPRDFLVPLPMGAQVKINGALVPAGPLPELTVARKMYIAAINDAAGASTANRGETVAMTSLRAFYDHFSGTADPSVQALLRDVQSADASEGQIGLAHTYWKRWGAHYTWSYLRSQQLQRRLNFKDPGSLIYGGDGLFAKLVEKGEEIYGSIEPPVPSGRNPASGYGYGGYAAAPAPTSAALSAYLSQQSQAAYSGGCFASYSQILMADGTRKVIHDINPGDLVWTPTGSASVKALVTIGHKATSLMMCQVGNTTLTPYHPIRKEDGTWVLPKDLVEEIALPISTIYNLVLSSGHIIDVDGNKCCTLAHGLQGPVIEHPFFGTEAVIDDLKLCPGWSVGRPAYTNLEVVRQDGVIVHWIDNP